MRAANKAYFDYLFLDIEWNQTSGTDDMENREPILLALVTANADIPVDQQNIRYQDYCDLTMEETCLVNLNFITIRSRAISLHFLRFSGVHPPGQRSAFSWC